MKSGSFHTTDIYYLNDPSELRHGIAPAIEAVKQAGTTRGDEFVRFSDRFESLADGGLERIARFFVCCVSAHGDDLGQWRAYGGNGHGFAIGFEAGRLEKCFGDMNAQGGPGYHTYPVEYREDVLLKLQRAIVDLALPLILMIRGRRLSEAQLNYFVGEICVALALEIVTVAVMFKHNAYEHEAELRFIEIHRVGSHPSVDFKLRPHMLVPYRTFPWGKSAAGSLKEIVIGPAVDERKARRFAKDCLRAFHKSEEEVRIYKSKVPYAS